MRKAEILCSVPQNRMNDFKTERNITGSFSWRPDVDFCIIII